jgi:RNA recognition motif-containing protein
MKDKPSIKDLYVANLSFDVEEEDLLKLFTLCGTVRKIHMITDAKSGQSKGCAFVHMATVAEAKDAITTLDGTRLIDRCISVTAALPRKTAAPASAATKENPRQPRRTPERRK